MPALRLLGRHVGYRAEGRVEFGQFGALGQQREAEVHHGHVPFLVNDRVARFDVAMDDALFVSGFEALGDLLGDAESFRDLQRPLLDALVEAIALNEGHRNECLAIHLGDLVNRTDVRVMEGRGGLRFTMETLAGFLVFEEVSRQELQRYRALELRVLGLVNDTIPPSPSFSVT